MAGNKWQISDELWEKMLPLIPEHKIHHPLGTHRRRVDNRAAIQVFTKLSPGFIRNTPRTDRFLIHILKRFARYFIATGIIGCRPFPRSRRSRSPGLTGRPCPTNGSGRRRPQLSATVALIPVNLQYTTRNSIIFRDLSALPGVPPTGRCEFATSFIASSISL